MHSKPNTMIVVSSKLGQARVLLNENVTALANKTRKIIKACVIQYLYTTPKNIFLVILNDPPHLPNLFNWSNLLEIELSQVVPFPHIPFGISNSI